MQLAVRSYLATGVAVAGVGVLAASPVAPPMPDLKVQAAHSSAAVELSALANPIAGYADAFSLAFQNAVALGQRVADNPAPILSQIVRNQLTSAAAIGAFVDAFGGSLSEGYAEVPAHLKVAAQQFADGDVTAALTTVQNALLGPVVQAVFDTLFLNPEVWEGFQNALRQPIANTLAIVDLLQPANIINLLGPLLAPVQVITDVVNVVGGAGDNIFAGIKDGDLEQVANAVLNFGPDLTNAILNGNSMGGGFAAGLLGPNGIVAGLITIGEIVADAITPAAAKSALAGATLLKTEAASTTVTLDVAPQAIEAPKAQEGTAVEQVSSTETAGESTTKDASAEASAPQAPAETPAEAPAQETAAEPAAPEEAAAEAPAEDAVKESPKAVPGKTGTDTSTKKANPLKDVGDGIRGALKNVGKGFKDAVSGASGKTAKPAKPAKAESTNSGGASGSAGGSSSAGGSESGGAE
ncbi:hypothetical protein [Mycolicibacterium wolinskyi]|uniref:hypothetical protein n=1 Tax=Mycolicibacterium wolinskyi TaxID=59750 RepID=UPI0039177980